MPKNVPSSLEESIRSETSKGIDVGVQVDFSPTPLSSVYNKNHHFIDLGYDSLHSTPKQLHQKFEEDKEFSSSSIFKKESESRPQKCDNNETSSNVGVSFKKRLQLCLSCRLKQVFFKNSWAKKPKKEKVIQKKINFIETEIDQERGEWDKKIDFLLSIIGFAVDLANVWRFPYLCYKNGGGVFLIPYTLMFLFGALPLFFLELSLGQFAKSGPISVWNKTCPIMKGVGYCAVLISWYVSFYYNNIISWTIYYIITTLSAGDLLPWQHCDNYWNTPQCFPVSNIFNCLNCTKTFDTTNLSSSAQEFFERKILKIQDSDGFRSLGTVRSEMVGCVAFVFVLLYFSLFKGVKTSGKVVWVTATAPYAILTILLIRGIFLPGAGVGIAYYLSPRLEKLTEPQVWTDAAIQVFFSIGIGFGAHLTYASFNKFDNNCYRDAIFTAMINSCTSFYSGFVIFTYLGYMAQSMNKDIASVAKEGYGLVFQVYPEAISTLPLAKFWSMLFFVMLLTLGIDSAMGGLEAVITAILDEWHVKRFKREVLTFFVLFSSFLVSLINCTEESGFTMVWFDTYAAGVSLLISALFEAIAVVYCYGIDRFCCDIEMMLGFKPIIFWRVCWKYISPLFLLGIIILSVSQAEPIEYNNITFSTNATVAGWIFSLSSVIFIPLIALIHYINNYFKKRKFDKAIVSNRESIKSPIKSPIFV